MDLPAPRETSPASEVPGTIIMCLPQLPARPFGRYLGRPGLTKRVEVAEHALGVAQANAAHEAAKSCVKFIAVFLAVGARVEAAKRASSSNWAHSASDSGFVCARTKASARLATLSSCSHM
jgi:hypothetical protein